MLRRTTLTAMALALVAATAPAQDARVELSGTAGWTFSDGVNVGTIDESPIQVGPEDAFSWGARLGFNVSENAEVGFLFGMQSTDLEAVGLVNRTIPQTVYNYHGYFAYNFGDPDAKARPYFLGGLGATQYGSLDTTAGSIGGETQFSTTWALGLKVFPSPKVGIRLETRWTPSYIKTDPEGYWCEPYWGCYNRRRGGVLEPVRAFGRHHHPVLGRGRGGAVVARRRLASCPRVSQCTADGLEWEFEVTRT